MRDLPENNLSYPVLIEFLDSSGSGFYLNFQDKNLYLVTAYHVIFDTKTDKVRESSVKLISFGVNDRQKRIEININLNVVKLIFDKERDVAMILLGNSRKEREFNVTMWLPGVVEVNKVDNSDAIVTVNFLNLKKFGDVLESNEVFVLGYPSSLASNGQIEKHSPLLRKGIVAGKNYLKKTIILDCPVYFGNSGGLAIEIEQLNLGQRKFSVIGVVVQYVPFIEQLRSLQMGYINTNMENSGYSIVVPADVIEEIINRETNKK